jgi:hypothetical protein
MRGPPCRNCRDIVACLFRSISIVWFFSFQLPWRAASAAFSRSHSSTTFVSLALTSMRVRNKPPQWRAAFDLGKIVTAPAERKR